MWGKKLEKSDIGAFYPLSSIDKGGPFGEPVDSSSRVSPGVISLAVLEEDLITKPFQQCLLPPVEEVTALRISDSHHKL